MALIIDKNLCTGCGSCVDACPFGAMELHDGVAVAGDGCTLCGACVDACPESAIGLDEPAVKQAAQPASGVWVFAEQRQGQAPEVVAELLGQGRKLADELRTELAAALLGHGVEGLVAPLMSQGADVVYLIDDPRLARFNDDAYADALAALVRDRRPEVLLAGATAIGRSLMPRLATAVATGLTADCTGLAIDRERGLLLQTRPAFGGNIMATIVCPQARPQMATVRPRVMKAAQPDAARRGRLERVTLGSDVGGGSAVLEIVAEIEDQVNLTGAEVIVCGGRGVGSAEGFELVRQLARELGGVVGATRGAVDSGWIGHAHQVGQTGRTVAPRLYIGLGVAGAVQHLVGMQSSDTIVAVNKDPQAAIFQAAHYGVVGDLFEVVPAMIARLRQRRGQGQAPAVDQKC